MKRLELLELKRIANEFVSQYCLGLYSECLKNPIYDSMLKGWDEKRFNISVTEDGGNVCISLNSVGHNGITDFHDLLKYSKELSIGSKRVICNEKIRLHDLSRYYKGSIGGYFELKELIQYLNDLRVVPEVINIECSCNKVYKLEADGVVYIKIELFDF